MSLSRDFLQEIKEGAKALGIAPTTLCQRAIKNGHLVERLAKKDAKVTIQTISKVRAYIEANRPREAAE